MSLTPAERARRYRERHPDRAAESQRKYAATDAGRARYRKSYRAHKQRRLDYAKARRAERLPESLAVLQRWKEQNPTRVRAVRAAAEGRRRSRAKSPADPRIEALYEIAGWLRQKGDDVHVDHIVPLARGGKHEYKNLQILLAHDNLRKGARMPWES